MVKKYVRGFLVFAKKKKQSREIGIVLVLTSCAVLLLGVLAMRFYASAFVGPKNVGGVGSGAISSDYYNNIGIGTSTARTNTKMLVIASTTGSSFYPFGIYQPDGSTPILLVRDDKKVSIGTGIGSAMLTVSGDVSVSGNLSASSLSAPIAAASISSGTFAGSAGGGNFIFPASLGVGGASPSYGLDVSGSGRFTNILKVATPVSNDDATPRSYVDGLIYWVSGSGYIYPVSTATNVVIGTSTVSSYKLDVSGGGRFTGSLVLEGGANLSNQNITGVNKLTVTTIDPVYSIGGRKYASYVSDTIGMKVEVYGKAKLICNDQLLIPNIETNSNVLNPKNPKDRLEIRNSTLEIGGTDYCNSIIDFNKVLVGSDLWLFWQTIKEGSDMRDLVVSLTPEGSPARVWYELNPANSQIILRSDRAANVSYHLAAPRHDADKWTNLADPAETGVFLPLK